MLIPLLSFCAVAPAAESGGHLDRVRSHLDRVIAVGTDRYGPDQSAMWLASIDVRNGGQPEQAIPRKARWYREINSPRGSNLYWDQPVIVAAVNLSRVTGEEGYRQAADAYVRDFLKRSVAPKTGLFLWGNHIYYDVFTDKPVLFSGGYHEVRPHTPAWEALWAVAPEATEAEIRGLAAGHVKDPATGLFCRHASPAGKDTGGPMPFLEAGGPIVQSLCWLAAKKRPADAKGADELVELALRVARYSFAQRGKAGLLRNQPVVKRWDYQAATTESGAWANALLRAADDSGRAEFVQLARDAVAAYLKHGWDEQAGLYYGQLDVDTGQHKLPPAVRVYMPDKYALLFDPNTFPTHNYPMSMGDACVTLWKRTGDDQFRQAIGRWVTHVRTSLDTTGARTGYAEEYGRCIHFLLHAADATGDAEARALAKRVADLAVEVLYVPERGMFRSHAGEDRCDAVDGVGFLLLALIQFETGKPVDLMGLGF